MPKVDNSLIGAAGVHFVVSELSLRGLIALPTVRNTAGVDVVVTSPDGSWHANLQVKASKSKVGFWPIGQRYEGWSGDNCYYVFVRYLMTESRFEAFLESAGHVVTQCRQVMQASAQRGNKPWAPWWPLPRDPDEQQRVRRQWLDFGRTQEDLKNA